MINKTLISSVNPSWSGETGGGPLTLDRFIANRTGTEKHIISPFVDQTFKHYKFSSILHLALCNLNRYISRVIRVTVLLARLM